MQYETMNNLDNMSKREHLVQVAGHQPHTHLWRHYFWPVHEQVRVLVSNDDITTQISIEVYKEVIWHFSLVRDVIKHHIKSNYG